MTQADPARIEAQIDAMEAAKAIWPQDWRSLRSLANDLLAELTRLQAERDALKKLLREGTDEAAPIGAATAPTDPKGCEQ